MVPIKVDRYQSTTYLGEIYGYLSDPRPSVVDAMMGLSPTMRFLTDDEVAPNDVLVGTDGSRYRVVRIWNTPAGHVVELAKES
ncbi:hypothetical protein [Klebsiella pneumoniae]|uniref:hypothetical protein n=1 Tax=Klebsiella pneumoniae TaxID=573 RepID=UPI003B58D5F4